MVASGNTSVVTAKPSSVPSVPDGLVPAIERRYGTGPLVLERRLSGGFANDVFLAHTASRAVVVRVKHPPISAASIAWEHRLVETLAPELPAVTAPLPARDGTTFFLHGPFAVWLLPHVAGRPGRPADSLAAARLLGRLHAAAARLELEPRPGHPRLSDLPFPEVGELPPELAGEGRRLRKLRAEAVELVTGVIRSGRPLTTGLVHGDFFPGNVLVATGRATALLDWEEAHIDWQVFELAQAVWEFARKERRGELDGDGATAFVDAYRDAGGTVPPHEDDLLVPFVRAKRVLEILRAPADRHVDWDYQRENLLAAERLA
jgi:Ser/Thr protein kinase RdoA (MazF antagonist)